MAESRDIILFHYSFSPYARRIVWYLNLRGIPYQQCPQPPYLPRPDTTSIGTAYRRIPILAIGRDIYHDTRLILKKLARLFPASPAHPALAAASRFELGVEFLLERWAIDGGLFKHASALLPSSLPLLRDPKFATDREDFSGRSWSKANVDRGRPEALVEMGSAFEVLEKMFFSDGRRWILATEQPSLADIEAVWPFHWLRSLPEALPEELIGAKRFPRTFAWIERFDQAVVAAWKKAGKAKVVKGEEALRLIEAAAWAEEEGVVNSADPSGLAKGQEVEVWPVDTGFSHKDRGKLVQLDSEEIVIEGKTKNGVMVRIHSPRHAFRIRAVESGSKL